METKHPQAITISSGQPWEHKANIYAIFNKNVSSPKTHSLNPRKTKVVTLMESYDSTVPLYLLGNVENVFLIKWGWGGRNNVKMQQSVLVYGFYFPCLRPEKVHQFSLYICYYVFL